VINRSCNNLDVISFEQRILFDIELLVLNLLKCVADASVFHEVKTSSCQIVKVGLIGNFSYTASDIDAKNPFELLDPRGGIQFSETAVVEDSGVQLDVCRFLVALLRMETASFIEDIERTDIYFQDDRPSSVEDKGDTNDPVGDELTSLPIAELFVSAHMSMALHSLIRSIFCEKVPGKGPTLAAEKFLQNIGLPRGNWWLLGRILKAYIAVQGQTGIVLLESIEDVVEAVARMDTTDRGLRQVFPEVTGASLSVDPKLFEDTEARTVSSSVKKSPSPRPMLGKAFTFADLFFGGSHGSGSSPKASMSAQSVRKSCWKWQGNDYVWVGNDETETNNYDRSITDDQGRCDTDHGRNSSIATRSWSHSAAVGRGASEAIDDPVEKDVPPKRAQKIMSEPLKASPSRTSTV
jgi:hypothetical protein